MNYILDDYKSIDYTAGSKARKDMSEIFECYPKVYLAYKGNKLLNFIITVIKIQKIKFLLQKEDTIIVQWPLYLQSDLKRGKFIKRFKGRKICIIHDINSLRYFPNDKDIIKNEISVLNTFDVIISHNDSMKKWLEGNGVNKAVYQLNMFDYLASDSVKKRVCSKINCKYKISIAGNLDPKKSGYIYKLINSRMYELLVYGVNFQENEKIIYKGSFSPEELPNVIEGDFGLVWDGTSTKCCEGNTGNYLRYNNPHKLSLYVCAAMPVIVWSESAIAKFVLENNIGFCVNSLEEIDDTLSKLTKEKYEKYAENVWQLSKKVREGYYTKRVLREIGIDV